MAALLLRLSFRVAQDHEAALRVPCSTQMLSWVQAARACDQRVWHFGANERPKMESNRAAGEGSGYGPGMRGLVLCLRLRSGSTSGGLT